MSTSIYMLNVGDVRAERDRLEFQHKAYTQVHGGLVPEAIRQHLASLGRSPVVADAGTGTGSWLRDLAAELPQDSQLDGYDIHTSNFLEPSQLPPNVTLAQGDVCNPLPDELHGKYDLVHVRFIMCGVKAVQWEEVAANLRALLKPGGYLLWREAWYPDCLPMTESFQKYLNVTVRFAASVGRDITAPARLLEQLERVGYLNCSQMVFKSFSRSQDIQKLAGQAIIDGTRQILRGIVVAGGLDWLKTNEDVDKVMKPLHDDFVEGACQLGIDIHLVVGQRPLDS